MTFTATSYILFTRDTVKLAAFYNRAFGFKVSKNPLYKETEWLELRAGRGFKVCFHRWPAPGSPKGNRNKMVLTVADVGQLAGTSLLRVPRWENITTGQVAMRAMGVTQTAISSRLLDRH